MTSSPTDYSHHYNNDKNSTRLLKANGRAFVKDLIEKIKKSRLEDERNTHVTTMTDLITPLLDKIVSKIIQDTQTTLAKANKDEDFIQKTTTALMDKAKASMDHVVLQIHSESAITEWNEVIKRIRRNFTGVCEEHLRDTLSADGQTPAVGFGARLSEARKSISGEQPSRM